MIKVVVIGSGNVAQHLIMAFAKSKAIDLVQVFARNSADLEHLVTADKITSDLGTLKDADAYFISISDSAIKEVSQKLIFSDRLVAHTSGSIALEELNDRNRRGVFYPLQTFSKNKPVDFSAVPVCLEAENESDYVTLQQIATSVSQSVHRIASEQRKALHVSAVFVSNFTNHLYAVGNDICQKHEIPFEILQPLIKETANKIMMLSPGDAQTGPAKRHDDITINSHLAFLNDENQKNIYELLTKSIQHDGKKL